MKQLLKRMWQPKGLKKRWVIGLAPGLLSGLGIVIGLNQGEVYLRQTLLPQVQADLSESLNRPVELGDLESLSLTHLRLGETSIPATTSDADTVVIDSVVIQFSLLESLRSQSVDLDITLVRPEMWIDQSATGVWLNTDIQFQDNDRFSIQQIRVQDGAIAFVPDPTQLNGVGVLHPDAVVDLPHQITLQDIDAQVHLSNDLEQIALRARATSDQGGQLSLRGHLRLPSESESESLPSVEVQLNTEDLSSRVLNLGLPPSVRFIDGTVTSQVQLQRSPQGESTVVGDIVVEQLAAWVEGEPNPFTETTATFYLNNQDIQVTEGFTRYGQIPFQVQGQIHLQEGLDLDAQVTSVSVADFMDTFNFNVPFATEGAIATDNLRVTGPLDAAVFSGTVYNAVPVQLDQIVLDRLRTDFSFDTGSDRLSLQDITANPQMGGQVVVQADIQLDEGDNDTILLTWTSEDLPGDAIAKRYGLYNAMTLPTDSVGLIQATGELFIVEQQPQMRLSWRSQGRYPTTGQVRWQDNQLVLDQAIAYLNDHPIQISGQLQEGNWTVFAAVNSVSLSDLSSPIPGDLTGELQISGSVTGLEPEAIAATGSAQLQLNAGDINAQLTLRDGEWQTQLRGTDLALATLLSESSLASLSSSLFHDFSGSLSGDLSLVGTLDDFSLETIQAQGNLAINEAQYQDIQLTQRPITANLQWQNNVLHIQNAIADDLQMTGAIAVNVLAPQQSELDLQLQLQDFDLASLPIALPNGLTVEGQVNLQSELQGAIANPILDGTLSLQNLAVNEILFEPLLQGAIALDANNAPGTRLVVSGEQDAIALSLDSTWQPQRLSIQRDQAILTANRLQPQRWQATIQDFALAEMLSMLPEIPEFLAAQFSEQLSGQLSGQVTIDLATLNNPLIAAEVLIEPSLLHPSGWDLITGELVYQNNEIFSTGDLQFGQSRADFQVQLNPASPSAMTATIEIQDGSLQDLNRLIPPIPEPTNMALLTESSQTLGFNVYELLQVPSETRTTIDSEVLQDRCSTDWLSCLRSAISGTFSSTIDIQGTDIQGTDQRSPSITIDVQGQDWQLGSLGMQSVVIQDAEIKGLTSIAETLTLAELGLHELFYESATGDRTVFDTQFAVSRSSSGTWTGSVQANDLSLAQLTELAGLSLDVTGNVDLLAGFTGTQDMRLAATMSLDNACIYTLPLTDVEMAIAYDAGQWFLNGSTIQTLSPEVGQTILANANSRFANSQTAALQHLIVAVGPVEISLAQTDLETFAIQETMPTAWQFYLDVADLDAAQFHQTLTQTVEVDFLLVDRLLNSPLGNDLLNTVGTVLHTPSRRNNAEALRAAIAQSLRNDNQISALEILQHYPLTSLHVDVDQLFNLLDQNICIEN